MTKKHSFFCQFCGKRVTDAQKQKFCSKRCAILYERYLHTKNKERFLEKYLDDDKEQQNGINQGTDESVT